jgi:hypothetical protein
MRLVGEVEEQHSTPVVRSAFTFAGDLYPTRKYNNVAPPVTQDNIQHGRC